MILWTLMMAMLLAAFGVAPAMAQEEREIIDLTYVPNISNASEAELDGVRQYVLDKFGIRLSIEMMDWEKYKLKMASNDLGDISRGIPDWEQQILSSKQALDLTELLKTHGQDFEKYHPVALDAARKYHSDESGGQFFLPVLCGVESPPSDPYPLNGHYVRWDYYKELGYPEINGYDEYLALLKQMQELHPTTEDGKKIYGMSNFIDYSALWGVMFPFCLSEGQLNHTMWFFIDGEGGTRNTFTDPNAGLWISAEIWHKAWNMGLCDPDMFTTKVDEYKAKVEGGQLLSAFSWQASGANAYFAANGQEDKGFGMVLGASPYIPTINKDASMLGFSEYVFITSYCKYPERAMELLNYFTTPEGSFLIHNGVEGDTWDRIDGVPTLRDSAYQEMRQDGLAYQKKTGAGLFMHLAGFSYAVNDETTGASFTLSNSVELRMKNLVPTERDYSEHFGVNLPVEAAEAFIAAGKAKNAHFDYSPNALMPPTPDEYMEAATMVQNYIERELPKAIMAPTLDEFYAIRDAAIKEMQGMGIDEAYTWFSTEWARCRAEVDALGS